MDNTEILTVPDVVDKVYQAYTGLSTPYFISHAEKVIRPRIYKGKGSPEELQRAIEKMHIQQEPNVVRQKLMEKCIGIDCSGFISHLLDAYTMQEYGKHVWEYYKRKTINPVNWLAFKIQPVVSMLNANTLSSKLNTIAIPKVKNAKPMDLIRFSGGKHIAMIYKIVKKNGIVSEIEFIHSTEGVGVTKDRIIVSDENKSILDQQWIREEKGAKYDPLYLIRYRINGNGIRRPLFLR